MKIRTGFVSNSSSTSFTVPAFLLTDEQKEMLLSMDDMKETKAKMKEVLGGEHGWENSKNDYPVSEEYHRIYEEMIKNGEWHDSGWETSESKDRKTISGSTGMWNGTIGQFMKKIGIDTTVLEIINDGHSMVHMATHPEAVKHHIWLHAQWLEHWAGLSDEDKEFDISMGMRPYKVSPYTMTDKEFRDFGDGDLIYDQESEDDYQETYSFVRRNKK